MNDARLVRNFSYVNGKWTAGDDGATVAVTNPADGVTLGDVASLSADQARLAVDGAHAAFSGWSMTLPQDRSAMLRRWFDLMLENRKIWRGSWCWNRESHLRRRLARSTMRAIFVEYYAEEAKRPNIEGVTQHLPDAEVELWREPVGVAALITPWNFPAAMLTRKAAAAMAAGCTVVAHPSAETPFSALALAELAERAGCRRVCSTCVTGARIDHRRALDGGHARPCLVLHRFDGYRQAALSAIADTVKRLVMELGGHAPFIVFDDADMDTAVDESHQGQIRHLWAGLSGREPDFRRARGL